MKFLADQLEEVPDEPKLFLLGSHNHQTILRLQGDKWIFYDINQNAHFVVKRKGESCSAVAKAIFDNMGEKHKSMNLVFDYLTKSLLSSHLAVARKLEHWSFDILSLTDTPEEMGHDFILDMLITQFIRLSDIEDISSDTLTPLFEIIEKYPAIHYLTTVNDHSLLHAAAKMKDKSALIRLLQNGYCNYSILDHNGDTALHVALKEQDIATIQVFADYQRPLLATNAQGDTALMWAIRHEDFEQVFRLLPKSNLHSKDNEGKLAIHHIANRKSDEMPQVPIEAFIDDPAILLYKDKEGRTAIDYAIINNNELLFQYFLELAKNYSNPLIAEQLYLKLFDCALAENNVLFLAQLLKVPKAKQIIAQLPHLMHAAVNSQEHKIVELFIEHQLMQVMEVDEEKRTALNLSASLNYKDSQQLLLKKLNQVFCDYLQKPNPTLVEIKRLLCIGARLTQEQLKKLPAGDIKTFIEEATKKEASIRKALSAKYPNNPTIELGNLLDSRVCIILAETLSDGAQDLAEHQRYLQQVDLETHRAIIDGDAIRHAIEKDDLEQVTQLVAQYGEQLALVEINNMSILSYAISIHCSAEMIKLLACCHDGILLKSHSNHERTPLSIACETGQAEIIEMLSKMKADLSETTIDGNLLFFAIVKSQPISLRYLLSLDFFDVNGSNYQGHSPLLYAVLPSHYHPDTVSLLLRNGATFTHPCYQELSLHHIALTHKKPDCFMQLLTHISDFGIIHKGASVFSEILKREDVCAILLAAVEKLPYDQLDEEITLESGQKERLLNLLLMANDDRLNPVIDKLLKKQAQPNALDSDNYPPLFIACMNGNARATELLLDAGAQAGEQDKQHGYTAFHCAAQKGNIAVMSLLLSSQAANIDILQQLNHAQESVLSIAITHQHWPIAPLLINSGAKLHAQDVAILAEFISNQALNEFGRLLQSALDYRLEKIIDTQSIDNEQLKHLLFAGGKLPTGFEIANIKDSVEPAQLRHIHYAQHTEKYREALLIAVSNLESPKSATRFLSMTNIWPDCFGEERSDGDLIVPEMPHRPKTKEALHALISHGNIFDGSLCAQLKGLPKQLHTELEPAVLELVQHLSQGPASPSAHPY